MELSGCRFLCSVSTCLNKIFATSSLGIEYYTQVLGIRTLSVVNGHSTGNRKALVFVLYLEPRANFRTNDRKC